MRMDRRAMGRFDPSDVVQEAMITAVDRLPVYAAEPVVPFYPWLRRICWEQLLKFHERHVLAKKRTVISEQKQALPLNDDSITELVYRLAGNAISPSEHQMRNERATKIREVLQTLKQRDREVIELRFLEHLKNAEIAAILEISTNAVRARLFRALQHLNKAYQSDA